MTNQQPAVAQPMTLRNPDWTFTSTRRGNTIKVDIRVDIDRAAGKVYVQLCSQDGMWFQSTRATITVSRVAYTVSDDFGLTVVQNMVGRVSLQSTADEFASKLAQDMVDKFHESKW